MPVQLSEADTITILVATDNHVGYAERDSIRANDSQNTFREIMQLAKKRDVDMVLLAGDLFHDNKPSRKAMYSVMESLRTNCMGDKPCELEMLSDGSETFTGTFNHANYEDQDINVAIPVFSIHGNHDDPGGDGHYSALDLLHMSGLVNYYGKMSEADKVEIKPVLLQKGRTKLALYGMSNIRDERLFRTFKDQNVTFFQPSVQTGDWFNIMSVHQNHAAHTPTTYLPENFLPQFMDLVVWGHEHECLIDPRYNPEMGFHVMQPGSSVATSLAVGEAVPKHVAILKVAGKEFKVEPILLKTVRPFLMKEIVLAEEPALKNIWKKDNNRTEITRHLISLVDAMIEEALQQWRDAQDPQDLPPDEPLPLIRLRVENTAPEGGRFDLENPQRFSNRFTGKLANITDVIQFHHKKASATRRAKDDPEMPDEAVIEQMALTNAKVGDLVEEFLAAQNLGVLPQREFGRAIGDYVDKDDRYSVETFVVDNLASQIHNIMANKDLKEDDFEEEMDRHKTVLEELSKEGKTKRNRKLKPKPADWDSDFEGGHWAEQPAALVRSDLEDNPAEESDAPLTTTGRGRGRGRGRGGRTAAITTRKTATAPKKAAPAAPSGRGKKRVVEVSEDEEVSDVAMLSDHNDDDDEALFVKPAKTKAAPKKPAAKATAKRTASPVKKPAPVKPTKQSTLNFTQPSQSTIRGSGRPTKPIEISDDEISDDDDAFEPPPPTARSGRSHR